MKTKIFALSLTACIGLGAATISHAMASHGDFDAVQSGDAVVIAQSIRVGQFQSAEHPTQGLATIVVDEGQRYLELDGNFRSDDGPDLYVLLHREATPRSYRRDNYISLGRLKAIRGAQRYAIPADASLGDVQSVVVWCREFNVTFGFATFK